MGGLFSSPAPVQAVAPIQDNSAQMSMLAAQQAQTQLAIQQAQVAAEDTFEADQAAADNLQHIELEQAKADAEKVEREKRIAKQKKDLLYMGALGVEDDDDDMLLLGGD